jgi:predicted nuclease of predicted toxin-antitoxin system
MRWLLDECVDAALARQLRQLGHDVVYIAEVTPQVSDVAVMRRATDENRLLLTEDKDFGDLVFRKAQPVPGLILLRISAHQRHRKPDRLAAAIERFGGTLLGRYTVIEEARFRSRPLRP